MKTGFKALVSAAITGALVISGSAFAATKTKANGYRCVSNKGYELKSASKAADCRLPYHWIKATATTASAKPKAKGFANAKRRKGHVAATEKKTINQ